MSNHERVADRILREIRPTLISILEDSYEPQPEPPPAKGVGVVVHADWWYGQPLDEPLPLIENSPLQTVQVTFPFWGAQHSDQHIDNVVDEVEKWQAALDSMILQIHVPHKEIGTVRRDVTEKVFRRCAEALDESKVSYVIGYNEILGKGWFPYQSYAPIRDYLEFEVATWHGVSQIPFAHKFTHPLANVSGFNWTAMKELWRQNQDYVCYDFYGDLSNLNLLRALENISTEYGKTLMIGETWLEDGKIDLLREIIRTADVTCWYELLSIEANMQPGDLLFGLWKKTADGDIVKTPSFSRLEQALTS